MLTKLSDPAPTSKSRLWRIIEPDVYVGNLDLDVVHDALHQLLDVALLLRDRVHIQIAHRRLFTKVETYIYTEGVTSGAVCWGQRGD